MKPTTTLGYHLFRRVVATAPGTADVLAVEELPITDIALQPTQALVRVSFAGVNFIDTYFRSGLYPRPGGFPFGMGDEGSGAVVKCGEAIADPSKWLNRRVAFHKCVSGSYSSFAVVEEAQLYPIPDGVKDDDAAATLLQGCTAHYLTHDTHAVQPGEVVLVQAAAGGTGLLISQMAKARGAGLVIGICGGAAKAELARTVGRCDAVIDYRATPDWEAELVKLTAATGKPHVVFDGVGKSTFAAGLRSLRRRGHMVTFGNASGPVDPVAPLALTQAGSITLSRPSLNDYMATREEAQGRVAAVFDLIASGKVGLTIGHVFSLERAADAHRELEAQKTTGKLLINCQE